MKKIITDYVKSLGGTTQYSGNKRIMYLNSPKNWNSTFMHPMDVEIQREFPLLPFKLISN